MGPRALLAATAALAVGTAGLAVAARPAEHAVTVLHTDSATAPLVATTDGPPRAARAPRFALAPPPHPRPKPRIQPKSATQPTSVSRRLLPRPTRAASPAPAGLLVQRLAGVGSAQQVVSVVSQGYGTSYATLEAFVRTGSGWQVAFGPWAARIGSNGFAPPGAKREGDLRTPSGSYGFSFFFGIDPNPGVRFAYRSAGPTSYWDDDPASAAYNEWVDTRYANAGHDPEPMDRPPVYDYGAVIDYNAARTPGLGSAIFLHVSDGRATTGCVTLPQAELLDVLRWLDPARNPRVIMGPASVVEQ